LFLASDPDASLHAAQHEQSDICMLITHSGRTKSSEYGKNGEERGRDIVCITNDPRRADCSFKRHSA
jgi:DNA-binding MurR/RpiR family transcriptional regulator